MPFFYIPTISCVIRSNSVYVITAFVTPVSISPNRGFSLFNHGSNSKWLFYIGLSREMNFVHLHHHKTSLHSFCSMYYLWSLKELDINHHLGKKVKRTDNTNHTLKKTYTVGDVICITRSRFLTETSSRCLHLTS